jgi:LCP family protein required for cell wall assembly
LLSFLRRVAIACVVVAVLAAAGVMAGDELARRSYLGTRKIHVPNLERADPGEPANYLLIGSDTRAGDNAGFGDAPGQRSDVMMVLHVDPANRSGMLVSFPRDLVVSIDGRRALLNSAYGAGGPEGPERLVRTLEENFPPLRLNHYIEVDFKGFEDIVDAIGRVKLWFPTPVHDPYSGLNVDEPGCVKADGEMALAYARSRHYYIPKDPENPVPWEWDARPGIPDSRRGGRGWIATGSDLDRIPRQQYFLRTISQAAIDKTAANPTKLNALLDAVKGSFTRDDSLKFSEIKALVRTFRGLNPARVDMVTLPVTRSTFPGFPANVVASDAAQSVINRLMEFKGSPPTPKPVPPATVSVRVVNGSGEQGAARRVADAFAASGFRVVGEPADADRDDYSRTQVRWAPDEYAEAVTVAIALGTLNMVPAISRENTLGADVLVIVGRDYDALRHEFPVPADVSTTSSSSTTTSAPAIGSSSTTTSTAVPQPTVDTRFVPVDPETGGPLVGCPS